MKIALIITRIAVGLLYLVSAIGYFFKLMPQPELQGNTLLFVQGMAASSYLFPVVKVIETLCAVALLSGRFAALATIVIFPITINIFLFHAFLDPAGVVISVLLLLGNLFLAYGYRDRYAPLALAK
jgi:putative oxidoreductase